MRTQMAICLAFTKWIFNINCFHSILTTNFTTNWLIKLDAFFSKLGAQTTVNKNVGGGVYDEQNVAQAEISNKIIITFNFGN